MTGASPAGDDPEPGSFEVGVEAETLVDALPTQVLEAHGVDEGRPLLKVCPVGDQARPVERFAYLESFPHGPDGAALDWLARYLVGLTCSFEVVQPPELVDHLRTVGRQLTVTGARVDIRS